MHQEIRRIQIERIKELLAITDAPLKQIAVQSGLYHVEYMMRVFQRHIGCTLSQYRKQMRQHNKRSFTNVTDIQSHRIVLLA